MEMSFKSKPPSLEQDYMNMNMGSSRSNRRQRQSANRKDKSRSQPIAIQNNQTGKVPTFLPLNGSPGEADSLTGTPVSPPQATPTGCAATIFPFSLNSPQSPIKAFSGQENKENMATLKSIDFGTLSKKTPEKYSIAAKNASVLESSKEFF